MALLSFLLLLQKEGAKKRSPQSMYGPISEGLDVAFGATVVKGGGALIVLRFYHIGAAASRCSGQRAGL
jgi:hypothetical protein